MTQRKTSLSLRTCASSSSNVKEARSTSSSFQDNSRGLKSSSPSAPLHQSKLSQERERGTSCSSSSAATITFSHKKSVESSSESSTKTENSFTGSSSTTTLTDTSFSNIYCFLFSFLTLMREMFAFPNFLSSYAHSSSSKRNRNYKIMSLRPSSSTLNCQQIICITLVILVTLNQFCVPVVEGQRFVLSGKTVRLAIARMYRRLSSFRRYVAPIEIPLLRPPAAPLEAINRVVRVMTNRPRPLSGPLFSATPTQLAMVLLPDRWRPAQRPLLSALFE